MAEFETNPSETVSEILPPETVTIPDAYMQNSDIEKMIDSADNDADPQVQALLENPPAPIDYNMVELSLTGLIGVLGGIITTRLDWSPLEEKEIKLLSGASVKVMQQYPNFNPMGPKAMAWIGLGGAIGSIAMPRANEKRARDKHKEIET